MSHSDVHDALKRLQVSFDALAESRQRLLDELERSTLIAAHRMESMAERLDRPEVHFEMEEVLSSTDGVPLFARTG